jgi:hypothetical protein
VRSVIVVSSNLNSFGGAIMRMTPMIVAIAICVAPPAANAADARRAGKEYFTQSVLPRLFENGCPRCHAVNYVRPDLTKYQELMPYLAMGDAPEKTAVIRKIANLRAFAPDRPAHPGGQRCASLETEPCKTILRWWQIEFGPKSQAPEPHK